MSLITQSNIIQLDTADRQSNIIQLDTTDRQNHEIFKHEFDCILAGGAVRAYLTNTKVNDYDLFFDSEEHFETTVTALRSDYGKPVFENEFMTSFKADNVHIQAMRIYLPIDELLDSFDFTICQFALRDGVIHTTPEALLDLSRNALVPHKITYPVASYRRSVKYQGYGFKMCQGSVVDFLEQLSNLESEPVRYID